MKAHEATVKAAIALLLTPSRVRIAREQPLPADVDFLLRVVTGDAEAMTIAVATSDHQPDVVLKAAAFFVEQVLLAPDADSYRVLGGHPASNVGDLRRNMTLLLKWLHPDLVASAERSVYASRVTTAWSDLKTPESRALYDSRLKAAPRVRQQTPRATFRARLANQQRQRALHAEHRATGPGRASLWQRVISIVFSRRTR